MPGVIETQLDRERDITIFTVQGDFTAQQASEVIAVFYDGEPTTHVLWDFSDATFGNISAGVPQQIAGVAQQHTDMSRPGGKTALVFTTDIGFGLGRMFGTFRELQGAATQYRTFRSRDDAERWLGADLVE